MSGPDDTPAESGTSPESWPDGEAPLRTAPAEPQPLVTDTSALIVDVGGFEGPLDLLLELARQHKVDLKQISILKLAEQYLEFIDRARRLLNTRRRLDITLAEHRAIVTALAERDAEAAAHAMHHHLDAVLAELESFATEKPDLFADLNATGATDR